MLPDCGVVSLSKYVLISFLFQQLIKIQSLKNSSFLDHSLLIMRITVVIISRFCPSVWLFQWRHSERDAKCNVIRHHGHCDARRRWIWTCRIGTKVLWRKLKLF